MDIKEYCFLISFDEATDIIKAFGCYEKAHHTNLYEVHSAVYSSDDKSHSTEKMITVKYIIYNNQDVTVSVDENSYLGVQDHELVIALSGLKVDKSEMILATLKQHLKSRNITCDFYETMSLDNMSPDKSYRFYDRLNINRKILNNNTWSKPIL